LSYCDWLIELGPGGGSEGGEVIAQGSPLDLQRDPRSQTGPYLKVYSQ
jgi:excinuclease ABC subunit A